MSNTGGTPLECQPQCPVCAKHFEQPQMNAGRHLCIGCGQRIWWFQAPDSKALRTMLDPLEWFRDLCAEALGVERDKLNYQTSFAEDLQCTEHALAEFFAFIRKRVGEDLRDTTCTPRTVGDVIDLLEEPTGDTLHG